jgi:cbb3-type cytochrome c oxidase subunit III
MQRSPGIMAAVLAGIVMLAGCSHGNQSQSSGESQSSPGVQSAAASPAGGGMNGAEASAGKAVFDANCSSCHGADGKGQPGVFPPLAGNPVVTGDATTVIHIVKYGLQGKIQVAGQSYNGQMPAWGSQLSDQQIAQAITYIRSAWGNKASAVTPEQVAAVKQ